MAQDRQLEQLALAVGEALQTHGLQLTCAESCTGGWVAQEITAIPGSSRWFERGFVTYSNAAKTELLDVPAALIKDQGAVSDAVARAMAAGALVHSRAQWAVAVTGVAGPTGGSVDKPVGTVWLAWATPHGVQAEHHRFQGDRTAVRRATVERALAGLLQRL
jgi:nicotinamide-nucleotide amidase